MAVTAILPVPMGFADRRDAVFAPVAGVSPLVRVVRELEKRCDVVVVTASPLADTVRAALAGQHLSKITVVTSQSGGVRAHCVEAGLRGLAGGDHVVVHDVEWPIVRTGTLDRIIAMLRGGAVAVMPANPVTDSVKGIDADGLLTATLDRSPLRIVQYPRGFTVDVLTMLVRRCGTGTFDELQSVLAAGTPLTLIEGDDEAQRAELPCDTDYLAAVIEGRQDLGGL